MRPVRTPQLRRLALGALCALAGLSCGATPTVVEAPAAEVPSRSDLLYMIMVDRFADGDEWNNLAYDKGDPQGWHGGDLAGVHQRIDHLEELGVGAVWLSPIFATRQDPFHGWGGFHGYWTWSLDAVEERFGSTEVAVALADELHRRGMRLILDMVYNHVGMDAPLLQERPDWFHPDRSIEDWQDPEQVRDGWVHGLPDLDQDNPEVRAWLTERTLHWVRTLNADGIRIDAVRHMPPDFVRGLVADVEAEVGRELWVVGEDFSGDPVVLAKTLEETGVDAVFDFPLHYALVDVFCEGAPVGRLASTLSLDRLYADPNEQLVGFLDNHDLPRVASRCAAAGRGPVELHQALAVLMSMRGRPSITWGTELPLFGAEEPDNRADYDWGREAELGGTIAEFAESRRTRPSLRAGEDWIFHLGGEDTLGLARITPEEVAVIVVNRGEEQATVRLPERLRRGATLKTFHEVVGDEGPFLRHRHVEPPPEGQRPRARHFTLFADSVMVGFLRPDRPEGFASLLEELRAEKAALRPFVVEILGPRATVEGAQEVVLPPGEGPLVLVGAGPELGHWDPSAGVPVDVQPDGGLRNSGTELPAWTVAEFKVVRRTAEGDIWQEGPNIHAHVGTGGVFVQLQPVAAP